MGTLLEDIERMLCVLLCMQPPEAERPENAGARPAREREIEQLKAEAADAAEKARRDAAKYQEMIAALQQQLSEGQTRQVELEATVEQLRAEQSNALPKQA